MSQREEKERARLKAAVADTQAATRALLKDAAALARQASVLQELAARTRAEAQAARARILPARLASAECLRTVPEAARCLHVGERTLRHVLDEPDLKTRLLERTRKVGIFYKFVVLLPPDLVADLAVRFAARRPGASAQPPAPDGENAGPTQE